MIVATAGHVDHGKSTLVQALTGMQTDRLPEEKRRALTIDLGFAFLSLPSGRTISFIDVPGHERFVHNMAAGAGGIDLGLLVVAADDGVMPQTVEHVAVLSLFGVNRVLVALTKTDRADRARCDAVAGDIRALLASARVEACGIVETAAPRGVGVDRLRESLAGQADALPECSPCGGFRLAVDRSFVVRGAGVVVTGTVRAGEAHPGDHVAIMPAGREARIRGIHAHGRPEGAARQGDRAALNLAGADRDHAGRGDWIVTPGILLPSDRIDVRLTLLRDAPGPLGHRTPVHVHHGAGRVTGRVALLEGNRVAPGGSVLAQLVLDSPLVPACGDRLVLRDRSARRTVAGARVLDPRGPARGRARADRLEHLAAAEARDPEEALEAVLEVSADGVDLGAFLEARNLPANAAEGWAVLADTRAFGRGHARRIILARHWCSLASQILEAVDRDHADAAERLGPPVAELRARLPGRPAPNLVDAVLRELCDVGRLVRRGIVMHRPGRHVEPGARDAGLWSRVEAALAVGSGSPPALHQLAGHLDLEPGDLERFLDRMTGYGLVVRIARNRYLTPDQVDAAAADARRVAARCPEGFAVGAFRDATGLGRNLAVDLLEYLDRQGVTRRLGDLRTCPADGHRAGAREDRPAAGR